ncbi:SDR family oxidoreductase [Desulfocurvibacter africanus]|uniref:Glucose 1-dehydrogenase n=1 Tax=Desulfocurvibacter africanus subsp. africanus str. Walvis Bay TaxID=690850 RepID=F3YTQ9_DESAF|nr:SDR family oxidoreductase [Desulfocurvibacter africanus]EGJ48440.1 Glucose 1-dehydrogenase [Desulfocurvibacter africanus subsp. africanus str. Walvis Bay]
MGFHVDSELPLAGQAAIVTGASSGIGAGIAKGLAEAGARVMVNYHSDAEGALEVVGEIRNAGGEAVAAQANVGSEEEVRAMFSRAIEHWGTVDILVNNAGVQKDAPFVDMSLHDWNLVLSVNLTGPFLCAREAVRAFLRHEKPEHCRSRGKIIFISSVHEIIPWSGRVNYAASKGGLSMLMKSLAQEVGEHKIRVNSIAPGAIKTPINKEAWETPEARKKLLKLIPYDRIGDPEDIARVAVWLASDESDYIHGATLVVDGGMTLYPGFAAEG